MTSHDLRVADVLHYATLGGAEALGMGDLTGSITTGKLADLVLFRQDAPSMTPVNNLVGTPGVPVPGAGTSTPSSSTAECSSTEAN